MPISSARNAGNGIIQSAMPLIEAGASTAAVLLVVVFPRGTTPPLWSPR